MRLTNRLNLPASIVSAVANDPYKGGGDISVTKLITPPYQRQLLQGLGGKLVEDVSDRIWSLMGQIGHALIERMTIDPATSVAEQRIYQDVQLEDRKVSVSGQFDLIESGALTDFKFTSVYSRDGKIEWEQQLNLLNALCWCHFNQTSDRRYVINKLQIVAVFRDWTKNKVGIGDYPESQVAVIPINLWPIEKSMAFLVERVRLHYSNNPAPCTDSERWATDEVFALMKKGRKTAVKLYKDEQAAHDAATLKGKDHMVIHRPVQYKRCEAYCSASSICPMWQEVVRATVF
jgi:hypothetical protein